MKVARYAVLLALVGQPVFAQDTRQAESSRADQRLNDVYQQILHRLTEPEQAKLKRAQHAWIAFRDLDCKWAFAAEPLDCMIDRTENRVRELEQTVFFDKKGAYQRSKDNKPKQ
jgi:uncharacterized protein YecT (DUF1311 family)